MALTLIEAWDFEDDDTSNGATCAGRTGTQDLAYSITSGSILRGTIPEIPLGGNGLAFAEATQDMATANSVVASLDPKLGMTLETIIKIDNLVDAGLATHYIDANNSYIWYLLGTGALDFRAEVGGVNVGSATTTTLSTGTAYHVVLTVPSDASASGDTKIFVNGVEQAVTTNTPTTDTANQYTIGRRHVTTSLTFNGTMTMFAHYDGEATQADVSSLYSTALLSGRQRGRLRTRNR